MGRLLIFGIAALVLDVFAIVDLVVIDKSRVRAFPKVFWIVVVVAIPFVGAFLWFAVGRDWGRKGGQPKVVAPDDDPEFLRSIRLDEEQQARIRKLEQELADLDDDPDAKK